MLLIAHTSEDGREQSFEEHAYNVAELAASFASEFGDGTQAYMAGLLHDVGKCALAVQSHLHGDPAKVEHSAAAAELFSRIQDPVATLLSYCVAGHHTGLPDGGVSFDMEKSLTLTGKLKRQGKRAGDYLAYLDVLGEVNPHIELPPLDYALSHMGFSYAFWTRMVFSCLVDADFLDTEAFMKDRPVRIGACEDMHSLLNRLNKRLARFPSPSNDLGYKRKSVLDDCIRTAERPRGLFTLTVPTGGGKTLSSLAFALSHAVENEIRRVIYVTPYTSIIEQTAREFAETFGPQNVLEHHSLAEYDAEGEEQNFHRLAAENWDLPVVVTTNVQFFESLFANKTSRCRKLHNIANSVSSSTRRKCSRGIYYCHVFVLSRNSCTTIAAQPSYAARRSPLSMGCSIFLSRLQKSAVIPRSCIRRFGVCILSSSANLMMRLWPSGSINFRRCCASSIRALRRKRCSKSFRKMGIFIFRR